MVIVGTVEGIVDECVSFHYDFAADVLYLRLIDHADTPAIGEDTPDDLALFRDGETDEVVGLDVISWWKRFGNETPCDSLREITRRIEPMTRRLMVESQAHCAL